MENFANAPLQILVLDTANGNIIGELWQPDSSVRPIQFSPHINDQRLLVSTDISGFERPLFWHPVTGEQHTLAIETLETLRAYQRSLFGGTPNETVEAHQAASPITYAEQLKSPILVIQGRNDTRCPARQMQAYETKLKSLDKSIQIHWFDAGHGSKATEQQIEHQALKLQFAYSLLSGAE
ncbi:MAG: alpha/beta hydrolase family protein [Leptolyngbyaceae cyanobacterium]